jgi:hypothetical protein
MRRTRRKALAATFPVLIVATLFSATMASTASGEPDLDLSSDAAIVDYLGSIGIDPADVVWQRGLRNYAGPTCPGPGWNCVQANKPIVQITTPLGMNMFSCTALECIVVQVALKGGSNSADCDRGDKHAPTAVQVCDVTQANEGNPNSSNNAVINQNIQQRTGSAQDARQVARITQTNTLGKNHAAIHQVIGQAQSASGGSSIEQIQEAHQAATVTQTTSDPTASQLGDNTSDINQRQDQSQRASGSPAISQEQNTAPGTDLTCDQPGDPTYDQQKNQCAQVAQHSGLLSVGPPPTLAAGGGDQRSSLSHDMTQRQVAGNTEEVDQDQGFFSTGEGGTKEQLSSGVSDGTATQDMLQVQTAPPDAFVFQSQDTGDPRCCWIQAGNDANSANIAQTTDQSSSSDNAFQSAVLQADCDSSGTCHVDQAATIEGDTNSNSCDEPSCHEATFNFDGGEL